MKYILQFIWSIVYVSLLVLAATLLAVIWLYLNVMCLTWHFKPYHDNPVVFFMKVIDKYYEIVSILENELWEINKKALRQYLFSIISVCIGVWTLSIGVVHQSALYVVIGAVAFSLFILNILTSDDEESDDTGPNS